MHTYKIVFAKDGQIFTELVIAFSEEDAKNTLKRDHPGVSIKSVTLMDLMPH